MKADIYELKTDVINLFKGVLALIGDADNYFQSKEYQEKLNLEISKIDSLELRMTITAPMKAGKSTIVNSLVGREILPNRIRAMTTIPTEIVFTPNLNEPTLKISEDSIEKFKNCWYQLRNRINSEKKIKDAEGKISSYDHLNPLLTEIRDALEFPINLTTQGDEQIRKSLEKLNDIIRLCSIIAPYANPLSSLLDIPRIETPPVRIRGFKREEMLGKLVIVDTPGINEVGENLKLAEVVKEELNKSSLILLVLDYERLDEQIAEEIRQNVQNFQQNVQNVQNSIVSFNNEHSNATQITSSTQDILKERELKKLYIIVNRIDSRKAKNEEEINKDKINIKNFVYSRYRLSEENNPNQLFEISAIRALRTTQLWLEMEKNPNTDISYLESLNPFFKESCSDGWEIVKDNLKTKELLDSFASNVWQKSGFDVFLRNAIDDLTLRAAPICIEDILINTLRILIEWQGPLKLRIKANSKNSESNRNQ